ncbi:MAG: ATP-grasp domain-containing protein [Acidobacteriota bacterium]|jgi:D-alanine-D-alanine ligase|nr:ATP-grasp domain-containing protein [Acidobacteriota bacterium]
MRPEKILICYNEPVGIYENYSGKAAPGGAAVEDSSDPGLTAQVGEIQKILQQRFEQIECLPFSRDFAKALRRILQLEPDIILNFVEALAGDVNFEGHIAGAFEILDIEFTGNKSLTLGNCLNKLKTKQILRSLGVRTPRHFLARSGGTLIETDVKLKYPLILKLNKEDASIGISENSVVADFPGMQAQLDFLFRTFRQDVLVEECLPGREISAAILGDRVLPLSEISYASLPENLPRIITYEAKWAPHSPYYLGTVPVCPAPLDEELRALIEKKALAAFNALDCRDYARVDFRLSKRDIPFVIDVNPNPDISPESGFIRSASHAGISYEEVLFTLVEFALQRSSASARPVAERRKNLNAYLQELKG